MPSRHVSVALLRPSLADRYLMLHADVWPVVRHVIGEHHIRNHSIYRFGDLLIRYYEYNGDDHDSDLQALGRDPRLSEWNAVTSECQKAVPGADPDSIWSPVSEICYLP